MYDERTEVDIRKMREEMDHRIRVLRPQLIEEVQTARAIEKGTDDDSLEISAY